MQTIKKILKFLYFNFAVRGRINTYHEIKNFPYLEKDKQERRALIKLNKLLNYAYLNIAYYKEVFDNCGIVRDGSINLTNISDLQPLPFLTKDIITYQKDNLHSAEISRRKSYKNTSGGSTGEPVTFMQDRHYKNNNLANFYIIESWRGAGLYDSRLKLWGAERDTFKGKKTLTSYVTDFITNTITLNSFTMSDQDIRNYINILNKTKPTLITAYAQSIFEIAHFAKEKNIKIEPQNAIHSAAGTLHDFMRQEIEEVFGCKVYNHYGSRELGPIASECRAHNGLHIMMDHVLVEIVDENGNTCLPEEEGEIIVTTLNNYSMPLIRYKIGDVGVMQEYNECSCGCSYPKLQKVLGRSTDIFTAKNGTKIDGEYFTHLFYFINGIKTFQVIQETVNRIDVKIIKNGTIAETDLADIEKKIKFVMGEECEVVLNFVDTISKTKTGKFLYTISKVK